MCAAHQRQNGQGEVIQFKEITRDFSWKRLLYQMVNSQRFSSRSSVEFPFHSTWLHSVILFWRVFFVVIFEKMFFHKVTALQQCHLICNICSILMNRTNPYSSPPLLFENVQLTHMVAAKLNVVLACPELLVMLCSGSSAGESLTFKGVCCRKLRVRYFWLEPKHENLRLGR